jgi:hypothetical protein
LQNPDSTADERELAVMYSNSIIGLVKTL